MSLALHVIVESRLMVLLADNDGVCPGHLVSNDFTCQNYLIFSKAFSAETFV